MAGSRDPNTNDKSNFGFTVKYLKNGQIQGNSLFIYRQRIDLGPLGIGAPSGVRDYNFIVKSNAMDALVQNCTTRRQPVGFRAGRRSRGSPT